MKKSVIIASLVLVFILVILSGCKTRTPEMAKVDSIVVGFDQGDPGSYDRVEEIVDMGPQVLPYMSEKVREPGVQSKWAALYVMSRVGYDASMDERQASLISVREQLEENVTSIKVMAGGVMILFGEKEGIPVLIDGLESTGVLLNSEPPMLICQYSVDTLRHYTGQNFGHSCSWDGYDESAALAWRGWWEKNKDSLVWDDEEKRYK